MPVNPGSRYPEPSRRDRLAATIRSNAVTVAFVAGEVVGALVVAATILIAKVVMGG